MNTNTPAREKQFEFMPESTPTHGQLPETMRISRVTLRVRSLSTLIPFYETVIGLHCVEKTDKSASFSSEVDGTPLLTLLESADASARPPNAAGLFHLAILLPNRSALADAATRIRSSGHRLSGASDHLVSEALYLSDPEGNGIEIYRDRPREEWETTSNGHVKMDTRPLDIAALTSETTEFSETVPAATTIGHVHLEVTDVERSGTFYRDTLGFDIRAEWDGALFLAAGDYHHHIGLNVWNGRTKPTSDDHCGLVSFELQFQDEDTLADVTSRLRDRDATVTRTGDAVSVEDPNGITVVLSADE